MMDLGELWIDKTVDGPSPYDSATNAQQTRLDEFRDKGYVILENLIPDDQVNEILEDVNGIYQNPEHYILKNQGKYVDPYTLKKLDRADRIVDLFAVSEAARKAILAPEISEFLNLIFGEPPIATQSIYFEYGSQQSMHQDTAYVISEKPLSLAACWIALEDISAGSGELMYYPGSHRFDPFLFSGEHKNWVPGRDGQEQHQQFLKGLHSQAETRGIKSQEFLAKKGDVLIWHADLAHGGSKITHDLTRRSLVAHYIPLSVKATYRKHIPNTYFEYQHEDAGYFTCRHYDIRPLENGTPAELIFDGGITKNRNQR